MFRLHERFDFDPTSAHRASFSSLISNNNLASCISISRHTLFFFSSLQYKKDCKMTMELLDTEGDETIDSSCREREREGVADSEKWTTYVEKYSAPAGQTSPKDTPALTENEPTTNHPVSSDQAARGGRGRKRKNTDFSKKV